MKTRSYELLSAGDPPPFECVNPAGASPAVLICDHASTAVPAALDDLGLPPDALADHIAWDPGAAAVARRLSALLDAPLVLSGYSRLVVDCNRPTDSPQAMAETSAGVAVPGNRELDAQEREARLREIFHPYHNAVEELLESRAGRPTLLFSIHSFTPDIGEGLRPWHAAVAYQRDNRLGIALRDALRRDASLVVGDNEPYAVTDDTDYSIPVHGERRGIPHVLLEMRQDALRDGSGQEMWAQRLAEAYRHLAPAALSFTRAG